MWLTAARAQSVAAWLRMLGQNTTAAEAHSGDELLFAS